MNTKQLYKTKHYIDKILLKKKISYIEISNSLLHIHRSHHDFLSTYFNSSSINRRFNYKIKKAISALKFSLTKKSLVKETTIITPQIFDILIVSHFVPSANNSPYEDFYFSQIINSLLKTKHCIKILYLNDVNITTLDELNRINSKVSFENISKKIPTKIFFIFAISIFLQSLIYRFKSCFSKDSDKKKFYKNISRMESSWTNLGVSYNIGSIVRKSKPKYIMTTFDGQAYERLIYFFSKKFYEKIICIGYLHSALFEHQISVKQSLGPNFDPDIIFTQGNFATRVLNNSFNKDYTKIMTIGSPRKFDFDKGTKKEKSILIIPSGFLNEVIYLFSFAKELAQLIPDYKIYFRVHPSFSPEFILDDLSSNHIANLFFSDSTFENAASACKFALFRDSTAIFNAIKLGLIPVRIGKEEEDISVNPIYGIREILPEFYTPCQFLSQIDYLSSLDIGVFQKAIDDIVSEYNESDFYAVFK